MNIDLSYKKQMNKEQLYRDSRTIYSSYTRSLLQVLNCCLGSMYFGYSLAVLNLNSTLLYYLITNNPNNANIEN